MKTFPESHYNSIAIPGSSYLHHDCNVFFLLLPYFSMLVYADVAKQGGGRRQQWGFSGVMQVVVTVTVVVHSGPGQTDLGNLL